MSEGRVEQVGTPEEIYHSPATVFVAGFIGTANLLPATVESVGADRTVVQLAGGRRAEVPTGLEPFHQGAGAMVMIRPERVQLGADEPGDQVNALPVTLIEMIFQGPVVRFVLRDGDDREIIAHVDDDERPSGIARGDRIWASWDPTGSRLLPPRA